MATKSKPERKRGNNKFGLWRGKPRYGYRDTPEKTWREDRKTSKFVWRKLGNAFPKD